MQAHSCDPLMISWCKEPQAPEKNKYKEIFYLAKLKQFVLYRIYAFSLQKW